MWSAGAKKMAFSANWIAKHWQVNPAVRLDLNPVVAAHQLLTASAQVTLFAAMSLGIRHAWSEPRTLAGDARDARLSPTLAGGR